MGARTFSAVDRKFKEMKFAVQRGSENPVFFLAMSVAIFATPVSANVWTDDIKSHRSSAETWKIHSASDSEPLKAISFLQVVKNSRSTVPEHCSSVTNPKFDCVNGMLLKYDASPAEMLLKGPEVQIATSLMKKQIIIEPKASESISKLKSHQTT